VVAVVVGWSASPATYLPFFWMSPVKVKYSFMMASMSPGGRRSHSFSFS
jgi:hypothetical protein